MSWRRKKNINNSEPDYKIDVSSTHKMWDTSTTYSITLNPAEQYLDLGKHRLNKLIDYNFNAFLLIKNASMYLVPEFSKNGRWHYHGWLRLTDSFKFHLHDVPIMLNMYHMDIDTIADNLVWYNYVFKNKDVMQEPLGGRYIKHVNKKISIKREVLLTLDKSVLDGLNPSPPLVEG